MCYLMSAPDSKYNHLLHAEVIYFSSVETDSLVVYTSGEKADKNHVFKKHKCVLNSPNMRNGLCLTDWNDAK